MSGRRPPRDAPRRLTTASSREEAAGWFHGRRTGNANVFLYSQYARSGHRDFHDITPYRQIAKNNGLYPIRHGFDLATGIGSPKMGALIR